MSATFYLLQSWQSKTNKIFFFSLYSMFINLACYIQQSSNKWSTKRNLQSNFDNFFGTLFLDFHGICKSILVLTLNINNIGQMRNKIGFVFFKKILGFYQSIFAYSHFSPKIQFLYCLLISDVLLGGPMVNTDGKTFKPRPADR